MADSELKILNYKIHKCSGHLSNYVPENIMIDDPSDQSSRWSTNTNTPPQFLTLKLDRPAIVKYILFGKYNKSHVCNLKKFTVLGGMQDGVLTELLSSGLENNSSAEKFGLRWVHRGVSFPVQYISVVPQQAWGPSFNYCIWYLQLQGLDHTHTVRTALYKYNLRAEEEIIRVCLKHLRQQQYSGALAALQQETGVQLEAPRLTQLYSLLVDQGNFSAAEELLQEAGREGVFDWYVSRQSYSASWTNISPCSPSLVDCLSEGECTVETLVGGSSSCSGGGGGGDMRPGQRGGHQMAMDWTTNTIYLFGGWDGETDLSDLWSYSIADDKWTLICRHSENFGGPSPRSCHKMVLDTGRRQIFTLGRYLDVKNRSTENIKSDLYVFDISEECWWQVCEDTGVRGGPKLLFDHQMCVDSERHIIYVFGGKVLSLYGESEESSGQYSGLYSYRIAEDRWTLLLPDSAQLSPHSEHSILSRASHSMLFHPVTRTLYIFGGQRHKQYLTDMFAVNVGSEDGDGEVCVRALCKAPACRAPPPGFTQRATIDTTLNEIYVLAGFSKEKDKKVSNSLWVFSLSRQQWSCIYKNENQGLSYWSKMHTLEPCPRFAHQLVYDPMLRVHYLFGGNPGRAAQPSLRLDDFWALRLSRISSEVAWRRAQLSVRQLQYWELVRAGHSIEALTFLQTRLHQAIDHNNPEEARQFQLMATMLFSEQQQALFFHPPLRAEEKPSHDLDSESAWEGIDDEVVSLEGVGDDAEQQTMFAAVLGMEEVTGEDGGAVGGDGEYGSRGNFPPSADSFLPVTVGDRRLLDKCDKMEVHYRRCQLFQQLSSYFPPYMVQPEKNLTDFITL